VGHTANMKWLAVAPLVAVLGVPLDPLPPVAYAAEDESSDAGRGRTGVRRERPEPHEVERFTQLLRRRQPIRFLGVPMRQIPTDNWLMGELITRIEPDFLVETGTLYGGSALYYAAMLDLVHPAGKVLTIDVDAGQLHEKATSHPLWKQHVEFVRGSSTAPEVVARIAQEIGTGKRVLVTLDSLHSPEHVRRELALYAPLVSKGSYLVLQDTFYAGLADVLDEFLAAHPEFERDQRLDERFVLTKYRGGFLRRR